MSDDFYELLWRDLRGGIDALTANRRARRKRVTIAAVAAVLAAGGAGGAVAAVKLLGGPPPPKVQQDLANVDRGIPADLRLNPDVASARAVATSGDAVLYAATLRGGGHCSELVTGGRARGAICHTPAEVARDPVEVALPSDDSPTGPVTIGGRANVPSARVRVAYGRFAHDVSFGLDRYFVFEVPAPELGAAHGSEIVIAAVRADGSEAAGDVVPADWDAPAVPDDEQPLFVSTRSDESDFTKVYGLEGHVALANVIGLELRYDDGERVRVPLAPNRDFSYSVPPGRVGGFMRPQRLVALDAQGDVVAEARVAAVAYWHRVARSP
jgi:hypothetical protein